MAPASQSIQDAGRKAFEDHRSKTPVSTDSSARARVNRIANRRCHCGKSPPKEGQVLVRTPSSGIKVQSAAADVVEMGRFWYRLFGVCSLKHPNQLRFQLHFAKGYLE